MREIHVEIESPISAWYKRTWRTRWQPVWSLERGLREVPREKYGGLRVTCYIQSLCSLQATALCNLSRRRLRRRQSIFLGL